MLRFLHLLITGKPWTLSTEALLFLMVIQFGNAQNSVQQRITLDNIKTVEVNGNQMFWIDVATHNLPEIYINSQIDGEYHNLFVVASTVKNNKLSLALEQNPIYPIPDDKRNAHKVVAAKMELKLPVGLDLRITSDIASVDLTGKFNLLKIELLDGFCKIKGNATEALISTIGGDIYLNTSQGNVEVSTRFGTAEQQKSNNKEGQWRLNSIRGDIVVNRTE